MGPGDALAIDTPERVALDLEVAGLGSRFAAQVADFAIQCLAAALVGLALAAVGGMAGAGLGDAVGYGIGALGVGALFAIFFVYSVAFEGWRNGQTPGKRWLGIRVVREGGQPVTPGAAVIRNVIGFADFLPIGFMLGAVVMLCTRRAQRLGDLAAGTLVVRVGRTRARAEPFGSQTYSGLDARRFAITATHLRPLGPPDVVVLREYFFRVGQMAPGARDRLTERLAAEYARRTALADPAPTGDPARDLLREVFLALREHLARQLG